MARRLNDFNVTHIFADGRTMTDEEFMAAPVEIKYENNLEVQEACRREFDPAYAIEERAKRRREYTALRKAELDRQLAEINRSFLKD